MSGNFGNLGLGLGSNADNLSSVQAKYLAVAGGGGGAGNAQSGAGTGGGGAGGLLSGTGLTLYRKTTFTVTVGGGGAAGSGASSDGATGANSVIFGIQSGDGGTITSYDQVTMERTTVLHQISNPTSVVFAHTKNNHLFQSEYS